MELDETLVLPVIAFLIIAILFWFWLRTKGKTADRIQKIMDFILDLFR